VAPHRRSSPPSPWPPLPFLLHPIKSRPWTPLLPHHLPAAPSRTNRLSRSTARRRSAAAPIYSAGASPTSPSPLVRSSYPPLSFGVLLMRNGGREAILGSPPASPAAGTAVHRRAPPPPAAASRRRPLDMNLMAQIYPTPSQTVNITVNPGRSWSFWKKTL
jgi:hypothetical protein